MERTPAQRSAIAVSGGAKHAPMAMAAPEFAGAAGDFPFYFLPYVSQSFGDGSLAHLPWLQELPDVLTSAMWSSWVEINPKTGERLGIQQGDLVEIASQQGSVRAPAVLSPGIAPDMVAMPVGQGHENFSRFASGRGANPLSILAPLTEHETGSLAWAATRVKLARAGGPEQAKLMLFAGGMSGFPHEEEAALKSIWIDWPRALRARKSARERTDENRMSHKWAMVVDLDRCTGCEACVVACHAENNIPTAGEDQAARGRAKHWIRVERYWEGDFPNPQRPLSAGPLPAVRRGALRARLPHLRQLSHARRAERAGLQPLHRHALLRQCLPLQRALLQFLQSRVGYAAATCNSIPTSPCAASASWRSAPSACSASRRPRFRPKRKSAS